MRKVIAIDFDGTLFTDEFPDIGKPLMDTILRAKAEQRKGAALILWTCREGQALADAIEACRKVGLFFNAVNANLPERKEHFGTDPRKVGADEYWDDRAVKILAPQAGERGAHDDFLGRTLKVGDKVVYCRSRKNGFDMIKTTIIGFTPQMVKVPKLNRRVDKDYSVIAPGNCIRYEEDDEA